LNREEISRERQLLLKTHRVAQVESPDKIENNKTKKNKINVLKFKKKKKIKNGRPTP